MERSASVGSSALVYALARLLFDRRAALIAAAFAALSPTLAFFSVEARAYGLAIALVAASTLAMLLAADQGRSRWWWVAYAGLSAAAIARSSISMPPSRPARAVSSIRSRGPEARPR